VREKGPGQKIDFRFAAIGQNRRRSQKVIDAGFFAKMSAVGIENR